ncbi:MAG TPA: septum formation initiator family protein [Atopostipes sp.]|nr:septum formation initiator family protein [Atopostipes sp.]
MKNHKNKNVTHLNTYSDNKTLDNIRQYKRNKFVRMRTTGIVFVGLILIALASLPLINNLRATKEYNQVHAQVVDELDDLETERNELEYQVGLLEDEEYIAKLARQELNVSKPNEILINIPEKEETTPEEDENTEEEASETNED